MIGNLDVDGDGRPDLVVGAVRENNRLGGIHVYSNRGTLLYRLTALPGLNGIGWTLARVGDVDQDGCDDFVGGAFETVGAAVLFSGRTGKVLVIGRGETDGVLGASVTGCGDLDGDGIPDFAAGTSGGFGQRGLVRAFSSRTGHALFTWTAPTAHQYGNAFGDCIASNIDLDRDGVSEVLIRANETASGISRGAVLIYSGRDGRMIATAQGRDVGGVGCVAAMRPQPGSPFPVFAMVETNYLIGGREAGRLTLFRGAKAVQGFGVACRGTLPSAPRIGILCMGPGRTRMHLSGAPPGAPALLLVGVSRTVYGGYPLPMPLTQVGFSNCLLHVSPDLTWVTNTATSGIGAGYASIDLPWTLNQSGFGLSLYGQWFVLGSGSSWPGGVTDALHFKH
jgi:hypothetical protein